MASDGLLITSASCGLTKTSMDLLSAALCQATIVLEALTSTRQVMRLSPITWTKPTTNCHPTLVAKMSPSISARMQFQIRAAVPMVQQELVLPSRTKLAGRTPRQLSDSTATTLSASPPCFSTTKAARIYKLVSLLQLIPNRPSITTGATLSI